MEVSKNKGFKILESKFWLERGSIAVDLYNYKMGTNLV